MKYLNNNQPSGGEQAEKSSLLSIGQCPGAICLKITSVSLTKDETKPQYNTMETSATSASSSPSIQTSDRCWKNT
jgi:hypothetical protein